MDPFLHPTFTSSDSSSNLDPMFSGMSLQTLLSLNPSLFYPSFSSLTDQPPQPPPPPIKTENPYQMTHLPSSFHHHHHHLPQLHSPISKRPRFNPSPTATSPRNNHNTRAPSIPNTNLATANDIPFNFHSPTSKRHRFDHATTATSPNNKNATPPLINIPQSNLARQRRQKLSEKTRCLQKLMPWDKKMDQATLLEEAYKYVKFLQAQLTVLQTMPSSSSSSSFGGSHNNGGGGGVFGDLERLNRNQVLQVLVNSPVAQTVMCSQGFCVYSMEQLLLLRKFSERRILLQQIMMSDHASVNDDDNNNNPSY